MCSKADHSCCYLVTKSYPTLRLQAPLSKGFSRQEYWSGFPLPPSGHLPNPGIKPASSADAAALQVDSLPVKPSEKPIVQYRYRIFFIITEHSAGQCCKTRNACSLSIPPPQRKS